MTGLLRVIDRSGERTLELPRGHITVGGRRPDSIPVETECALSSFPFSLEWNARHATWFVQCAVALAVPVSINGRLAEPGQQFPLGHLDIIELPGVFMQLERQLAEPILHGYAVNRIPLGVEPLSIGRADPSAPLDANHVDLDADETSISRLHVRIEPEGGDFVISDLSRTGVELNGVAFTRERMVFGDRFRISSYIFEFSGDAIQRIDHRAGGAIRARDLTVIAGHRHILEGVSLDIAPGEFIGVLGGSGQGKSTLLNALCGINPPTSGEVAIGGVPLSDRARWREIGIGFVPQDDIVHRELSVTDAITYSARLRLALPRRQIDHLVGRVIGRLGLTEHAAKRVADLSGGQRKRVSIAIELLAKPSVLFLDEPSSGLDPATEEALMTLLQSLTLTKLTVVCTTHVLQKAYLFDRIVFIQGGRLVFAGDTDDARQHFLQNPAETATMEQSPLERVYALLANDGRSAAQWEEEYRASPFARRAFPALAPERPLEADQEALRRLRVGSWKTLLLLAARQWRILCADPMNVAFILAQPLLIGFLVSWVADEQGMRLFLCVVATMWFGCSNGAQQIVGELPIFRRERVCGQGINAYILSKLGFLSLISMSQAALLFFTMLCVAKVFHPETVDRDNLLQDMTTRLTAPADPGASTSGDFEAAGDESASTAAATPAAAGGGEEAPAGPRPWVVESLIAVSQFFQISQNLVDSGPRALTLGNGTPLRDSRQRDMILPPLPVLQVLGVTLGFRLLAIAGAALVSVSIGLAISSLVKNTTQAVLWVPLVLIPQILFGGVVVGIPNMAVSVRAFSNIMPSFAAQRLLDVSSVYGLATPFLTNRTKTPLFLNARGDKETVKWDEAGKSFSQSYDKVSPVNISWQNLAVLPDRMGQHKEVGDRSEDGFHVTYRDTVESRNDVKLTKGTLFLSLVLAQVSLLVLGGWVAGCYATILTGLKMKETGK
jgi:ABC-type multidrug transport system ATPase subunit